VSLFPPPPYRQPLLNIHTHPWPGGVSFLLKNPPPSVGFEPTSAGTATSEHCLRQPCGHRATFPCFLVHSSVIYHCFTPATYVGPFPFFVPLFVPAQYLPYIFLDPFHQSLPLCIFHLVFGFSFPIPPLLFPISYSSFSYSPFKIPSQEYPIFPVSFSCVFDTSSCCLHLFTLYCHYFPPFIAYINFSFHASFIFSLFLSLFFNPQFHPCYYSPCSSSLFLFSFCPLIFPFVIFL
jgi:hypothetical protein